RCFGGSGSPQDSRFSLNYLAPRQVGLFDYGAYVWANDAAASFYTPNATYSYNSGTRQAGLGCLGWSASNTVEKIQPGDYVVQHSRLFWHEAVPHVTAYGTDPSYCNIDGYWGFWSDPEKGTTVRIQCYDPAGNLKDSRFVETFSSSLKRSSCLPSYPWLAQ